MEDKMEFFTGVGTYNRNTLEVGICTDRIYVDIDDEYRVFFTLDEAKRMSDYLIQLIKEKENV